MRQIIIVIGTIVTGLSFVPTADAQQLWTLQQCIEQAVQNNISVQQSVLRSENQEIELNSAKNSRLPSLSAGLGGNTYFGRGPSRDGTYQDNTQLSASGNLSLNVPIFAGFTTRHNISGAEFNLRASLQDIERVREDLSMQITTLYLQVLLNKELLVVAKKQVELSRSQLERSQILFDTGKNPESQLYDSKALIAKDELSRTQCENSLKLSLLDLTQAMNLDSYNGFDIKMPKLDDPQISSMNSLGSPEAVYGSSVDIRPSVIAENLRLESSRKRLLMAKAARYPQISLGAGYSNSSFYSFVDGYDNVSFLNQLKNNGSESVGLNINIPIFNRFATRNQIRSSKINVQNQQLALSEVKRSLYKDIEQSYYNALAAYHKYLAAVKSVEAAREAFRYEQEKSRAGRSTVFDFNDAKTRLERSESDAVQSKFEFVFRRKILDFYSGEKLEFYAY